MSKLLLLSLLSLHHGCLALLPPPMPVMTPLSMSKNAALGNRENVMARGVQIFLAKDNDDDLMNVLTEGRDKFISGKTSSKRGRGTNYAEAAAIQSAINSGDANKNSVIANFISLFVASVGLIYGSWKMDAMRKDDRVVKLQDRDDDRIFGLKMLGKSRDSEQTLILGELQFKKAAKDGDFGHHGDQNPSDLIERYEETIQVEGINSPVGKYLASEVVVLKKKELIIVAQKKKAARQKKLDDAKKEKTASNAKA